MIVKDTIYIDGSWLPSTGSGTLPVTNSTTEEVMGTVPGFASSVQTIRTNLSTANPALATLPIWITENNVNADFDAGNGKSACNPGQTFVDDLRGSDAFFAAWRPYVFSQVAKVR